MDEPPTPSTHRFRSTVLWWGGILLAAAGAMAAGFYVLNGTSTPEIAGELLVRTNGGVFTLRPNTCHSFNRDEGASGLTQFGVTLLDDEVPERSVWFVEDPALGTVVTVHTSRGMTPVMRSECDRLDVTLRETGTMIYDVWGMEGSADLHCKVLQGEVSFKNCY